MKILCSLAVAALLLAPLNLTAAEIDDDVKAALGGWKLSITTPDGVDRTPTILLGRQNDELVAWYVENEKRQPFKSVKIEGESIVFSFRPKEREDIEVTLKAKRKEKGQCVGTASFKDEAGEVTEVEFSGKQIKPADFDEAQTWTLKFTTPDDKQHEAEVIVLMKGDKTYAWYTSEKYDIPAKKLTIDGEKVAMEMSIKTPEGATVDVTFRGTVAGEQVSGDVEYDVEGNTGSFPYEGSLKK